ncbi:hypothetical protein ACHQM5_001978 [Ranunculus cassubicifolius]
MYQAWLYLAVGRILTDAIEQFVFVKIWDDKEDGTEATQQWEDDWDDDDVNDDFSIQLKKELQSNAPAAAGKSS